MRPGEIGVERASRCFRVNPEPVRTLKELILRRGRAPTAEVWALRDVSVAVEPGEHVGLVGRNGSGKSTFLKILAGKQTSDSGEITQRRDMVISYLSQEFTLDPEKTVYENVRGGAKHVLDLIAEFESLPAESKRHEELEQRIVALDGWGLDNRLETAMSHLNVPDGARSIDNLSGGEKRRVAMCRAIVSRPGA